jgi:hypothetical protein
MEVSVAKKTSRKIILPRAKTVRPKAAIRKAVEAAKAAMKK